MKYAGSLRYLPACLTCEPSPPPPPPAALHNFSVDSCIVDIYRVVVFLFRAVPVYIVLYFSSASKLSYFQYFKQYIEILWKITVIGKLYVGRNGSGFGLAGPGWIPIRIRQNDADPTGSGIHNTATDGLILMTPLYLVLPHPTKPRVIGTYCQCCGSGFDLSP
jgi:hypothetical protein